MRLFAPDQVPHSIQGRVCRQSRTVSVICSLLLLTMFVAVPTFFVAVAHLSIWISFPILSFLSLLAMWFIRMALNAVRTTNWLMQIAPDGLWINLRSYQNCDFEPAATVLFVPYQEIASVGAHTVKRSEHSSRGVSVWTDRYLDVRLVQPAPDEVGAEIAEERRRVTASVHLGGFVTARGRNNHVPVWLPSEDVLRLAWRTRTDFIGPSLKKTLRALEANCRVGDPSVDAVAGVDKLTSDDVDRMIIECVETGDTFGAVELLREKRGFSLDNAKKFIDELTVRL